MGKVKDFQAPGTRTRNIPAGTFWAITINRAVAFMFVSVLSWIYLSSVSFSRNFNVAHGPLFVYPWYGGHASDETENNP